MGRTTNVAVWASELKTGSLPPVCVKSGQAADSKLTFEFMTATSGSAVLSVLMSLVGVPIGPGGRRARGPLPLTKRWRRTFIALRGVAIALAAVAILALISTGLAPLSWRQGWLTLAFGSLVACLVVLAMYGGLKPKGHVHKSADHQIWVDLEDVHPGFVDAINAIGH